MCVCVCRGLFQVDLMSVAEEAQAITQARAELLSGPRGWNTDAETPTEWPPAGSPYADTVTTVWQWMSESSRAGTVPYQYAADLEDLFQNILASERLASELFTSVRARVAYDGRTHTRITHTHSLSYRTPRLVVKSVNLWCVNLHDRLR